MDAKCEKTRPRHQWAAVLVATVLLGVAIGPAAAGLFSEVGKVFGVSGDGKKVLDFADGLLPGGGGATDRILGAPAKAAFGDAINDWKTTNESLIDKLGSTNDQTVEKLIQGLSRVSVDIDQSVYTLGDILDASISSLDESLQQSIERLDNSFSNQTGRLDTIFQKQTSTFFYLGRVFLSVLIIAGLVFSLYFLVRSHQEKVKISTFLRQRCLALAMVFGVASISLVGTWIMPDPSGLRTVERQYQTSYLHALNHGDFIHANFDAAQLTILQPNSSLYRGLEVKSKALRDLFYRQTVLFDDDATEEIIGRLSQSMDYQKEFDNGREDPDIAGAMALVAAVKSDSPAKEVLAEIAASKAVQSSSQVSSKAKGIARLRHYTGAGLSEMRQVPMPMEVITFMAPSDSPLVERYLAFLSIQLPPVEPGNEPSSRNNIDQLGQTMLRKVIIRNHYRRLTARYSQLLHATMLASVPSPGLSEQERTKNDGMQRDAFCALFKYLDEWHVAQSMNRQDVAFVSAYLSGPFILPARAVALRPLTSEPACTGLENSRIIALSESLDLWVSPLKERVGVERVKGISVLQRTAERAGAAQKAAFEQYEKLYLDNASTFWPGASFEGDSPSVKNLRSLAGSMAVLGLYDLDANEAVIPAIHRLRERYEGKALTTDTWKELYSVFFYSTLGG